MPKDIANAHHFKVAATLPGTKINIKIKIKIKIKI
jgi:hypothetical protein